MLDRVQCAVAKLWCRTTLHFEFHTNKIARRLGKQYDSNQTAVYQAQSHDKEPRKQRDHEAAIIQRFLESRRIVIVNQAVQAMLNVPLNLLEESRYSLQQRDMSLRIEQIIFIDWFDLRVHQMRGENHFGLDQRKQQAQHYDHRHSFKEWSYNPADKQHWRERSNRRKNSKCRRHRDLARTFYNIVDRVPVGSYFGVNAFTNDDCVVDHDAEHDDKAKQTDHVDRNRPRPEWHQEESTQKCDRNANDDPAGDLHPQE